MNSIVFAAIAAGHRRIGGGPGWFRRPQISCDCRHAVSERCGEGGEQLLSIFIRPAAFDRLRGIRNMNGADRPCRTFEPVDQIIESAALAGAKVSHLRKQRRRLLCEKLEKFALQLLIAERLLGKMGKIDRAFRRSKKSIHWLLRLAPILLLRSQEERSTSISWGNSSGRPGRHVTVGIEPLFAGEFKDKGFGRRIGTHNSEIFL